VTRGALATLTAVGRAVVACQRCPRLRRYCAQVARERRRAFREQAYWGRPSPGFGDPRARLLVVGLAPAAHGGNRTGRMFTGDASGDWLFEALHRTGFASQASSTGRDDGLRLAGCWVTAAVRCAPPGNRPTTAEQRACRRFLAAEIAALPRVAAVVCLGRLAHDAWLKAAGWWARLAPRDRPRFTHAAVSRLPDGTALIASYHPSRQNTSTGLLTRPRWHLVFRRARRIVDAASD
jgi:uracil-DNA glycosylase family 4